MLPTMNVWLRVKMWPRESCTITSRVWTPEANDWVRLSWMVKFCHDGCGGGVRFATATLST